MAKIALMVSSFSCIQGNGCIERMQAWKQFCIYSLYNFQDIAKCYTPAARKFKRKMFFAAGRAGDADSSRAPGLASCLQGSVNVHRGALLMVPEWQCTSSFVFYTLVWYKGNKFKCVTLTFDKYRLYLFTWLSIGMISSRTIYLPSF